MSKLRSITAPSGSATQWPEGTRIGDILEADCPASGAIAALLENDLVSLSGGYAETNGVNRWIVSPARFLVTGDPVTLIFTR